MKLNESEIKDAISKINSLDLNLTSIREIEELLTPLFKGTQLHVPRLDSGTLIFRGRVCDKPISIEEVTYPDKKFVKQYGRANDIEQPIFYASIGQVTPLGEIRAKEGDTVVMSNWITKSETTLSHVGFTSEVREIINSKRPLESIYNFVENTNNFDDLNRFVYNYLGSKFIIDVSDNDNYKYKISVAITNKLLNGPLDGLIYPSLAFAENIDNVVLKPDYVDKHLQLVSIEFYRIRSITKEEYKIDYIDTATEFLPDGTINWSGRMLSRTNNEFSFKEENGVWVSRNNDGKFIFPESKGPIIRPTTKLKNDFKELHNDHYTVINEIPIETTSGIIYVDFMTIYLSYNKEKFISFYIPQHILPIEIAGSLLNKYADLTIIGNEKIIQVMDDKSGTIDFTNENHQWSNRIEIYSEIMINEQELRKYFPQFKIIFRFPT